MNFELFIQKLQQQLLQPLPGESAQMKMAPLRRLTRRQYYEQGNQNAKLSAVLICLYPKQEKLYTVLMLRPSEQGMHSDQVSFPGGGFEQSDEDLKATALREAKEELGIESPSIAILGALTPVYIPVSNFLVEPFITGLIEAPHFKRHEIEVKDIIETEVEIFLDEKIKGISTFKSGSGFEIEAPYYEIQQHKIWGATAMMLSELEAILRQTLPAS